MGGLSTIAPKNIKRTTGRITSIFAKSTAAGFRATGCKITAITTSSSSNSRVVSIINNMGRELAFPYSIDDRQ